MKKHKRLFAKSKRVLPAIRKPQYAFNNNDLLISHRREIKLNFSRPIIKITRRPWTSPKGPFGTECGSDDY
jgi:hypothetical protein